MNYIMYLTYGVKGWSLLPNNDESLSLLFDDDICFFSATKQKYSCDDDVSELNPPSRIKSVYSQYRRDAIFIYFLNL